MTESGTSIEPITFEEALEQRDAGIIDLDKWGVDSWKFNFDIYLEKLGQTDWANAWMLVHKGLNNTVEYTNGNLDWLQEDVDWFEDFVLKLGEQERLASEKAMETLMEKMA